MTLASQPVLVATDLSPRADRAVDRAVMLGQQLSRPVIALHVIPSDKGDLARAERQLKRVLPHGGEGIRTLIGEGSAVEEITSTADEEDAALICTGVARINSIGDLLLGTSVDALVRYATKPVLVVKERPWADYETIIFPTDFSACSRDALLQAMTLFPHAKFQLLHAFHVPYAAWNKDAYVKEDLVSERQSAMDTFVATLAGEDEVGQRLEARVVEGNLSEAICKLADEVNANLAAFGTHGESGFRHATIGSMANELLNHLPLDSLIIRPVD